MSGPSQAWPWTIPATWSWAFIGEITDVVGGGTPPTGDPRFWAGGDIPWITPADLSGYTRVRIDRGKRFITRAGLTESAARMLPEGTVLMSSRAPVGYAAIASRPVCTNQGFKSFLPTPSLLPDYLYYFILGNRSLLLKHSSGTTFQEISGRSAAKLPVPVPPVAEQGRIVAAIEEHLSRLDASVAVLRRVKMLIARYRTATLKATSEGRLSNSRAVPVRTETLGSLLAVQPQNGRSVPSAPDGFPVLRLTAVKSGRIDLRERKLGAWSSTEAQRYLVNKGDFFVVRGNGSLSLVGRGGLVVEEPDPVAFPDTLIRVRVHPDIVLPEFLAIIWNSPGVRSQIERHARTSAGIYKINQDDLRGLVIPVPRIEEQALLVSEVERRLSVASAVQREVECWIALASGLRQSILTSAFKGKLVAQYPSDEPASVLLDRTCASGPSALCDGGW